MTLCVQAILRELCIDLLLGTGYVINPRRACAARVTVVGSVCMSVRIQNLTYHPTNDTTYLTGNEGQNNCAVFSENAPLQS